MVFSMNSSEDQGHKMYHVSTRNAYIDLYGEVESKNLEKLAKTHQLTIYVLIFITV